MSTPGIIYDTLLNSDYFSGSVSPDTQEYHKGIINIFVNYASGSTVTNLWEKLDFFYFFDTDNESLRFINWKQPNTVTASIQNDNYPIQYNYKWGGPAQDQVAKWWDGKSTPFSGSYPQTASLKYAWETANPEFLPTASTRFEFPYSEPYNALFQDYKPYVANPLPTRYYVNKMQNWVIQNNYLPNLFVYPPYYQGLQLDNGTYYNTNYNFKKQTNNYRVNNGFLGVLKLGPSGGVFGSGQTSGSNSSGSFYMGVADPQDTNKSICIKINKQYFHNATGSDAKNYNTGFQAGLGIAVTSSFKETSYTWRAFTGSNPYPQTLFTQGNSDFPSSQVTMSNESARAGRPGLYIAQRYTSSFQVATVKQYYNNILAATSSFSSLTGSIPDGTFLVNGLGSPSYVKQGYVSSTTEPQFVTRSLGIISNVATGSYYGNTRYTSSATVENIVETSTKVLTYYTGSYNSQTGKGDSNAYFSLLPTSITAGVEFTVEFNIEDVTVNLPQYGDKIHIGLTNNEVGTVVETVKYQSSSDNYDYYYRVTGVATKTTGSGINNGNSTVVRFYENSYIDIGQQFNSRRRETLYSSTLTVSGSYTTSSLLNQIFLITPMESSVVGYPFNGTNGRPLQELTFTQGVVSSYVISSSISLYPEVGTGLGCKVAIPVGNDYYYGPEFGITYYTDFTGSYLTSSAELETLFIANENNGVLYSNNYLVTNGTYYVEEPSVEGETYSFRYEGLTQASQLVGIIPGEETLKITTLNPNYGTNYVYPNGTDTKDYDKQSDVVMCVFGGGGINGLDLSLLYEQLYNLIYSRAYYKVTAMNTLNYSKFTLGTGQTDTGFLYYSDDQSVYNIYPQPVNYPFTPTSLQDRVVWNATLDIQGDSVGTFQSLASNLINPL